MRSTIPGIQDDRVPAGQTPGLGIRRRGGLIRATVLAALSASLATEGIGLIARLAGVPMKAQSAFDRVPKQVRPGDFALTVVPAVLLGALLAAVLARFCPRPRTLFVVFAGSLTAASLLAPLSAPNTTEATRLTLAAAHVLTAVIAIPLLAGRIVPRVSGGSKNHLPPAGG
jgi:hypothetical protein